MTEYQYLVKAIEEEPTIEQMLEYKGHDNRQVFPQEWINKGLHITPINTSDNSIHLQFHGWELVLLKGGTYYINDTSGG